MNEILTIAEIEKLYPDEWVLLNEPEVNEVQAVVGGKVLWHCKDKDEIDRVFIEKGKEMAPFRFAILYTGSIPDDVAFAL